MDRRAFFSTLGLLPLATPVEMVEDTQFGRLNAAIKREFNKGRHPRADQKTVVFVRKEIVYNYLGDDEALIDEYIQEKFDALVKEITEQLEWFCDNEHEYDGCVTLDEYFPRVDHSNGLFLVGWARMKIQM